MKEYKCHKVIHAEAMTLGAYYQKRGWVIPSDEEDPWSLGYLVSYDNGADISWSPKDTFEEDYLPCGTPEERMSIELVELQDRIQKLEKFFGLTDAALIVGKEQYDLMVKQLNSMRMYRGFLVERKEMMCKNL